MIWVNADGCDFFCLLEHEGAVTAVDISSDGIKILAATCTVSIKFVVLSVLCWN